MASSSSSDSSSSAWPVWVDDSHLDCQWLASKTTNLMTTHASKYISCFITDMSNATRRGATPREGATLLLTLIQNKDEHDDKKPQRQRAVMKQVPAKGLALSRQLGLAREALFYQHLATRLPSSLSILPTVYYSAGEMDTGRKCIILQDLTTGWVDSGIYFGPGNPNNWTRDLPRMIATNHTNNRPPPTCATVAEQTFCAVAVVHATFWKRSDWLLTTDSDYQWLRGHSWLQGKGRDSWEASQKIIQDIWTGYCAKEEEGSSTANKLLQWDPVVRQATAKAMSGISWDKQLHRLSESRHWTLVHGDFWPGNVMWNVGAATDMNDNNNNDTSSRIRLLDWEMVGLGSGPQDLGQYVLSNMDPAERRACERRLVQAYYDALCQAGVNNSQHGEDNQVTLEYCWEEYQIGGLERWLWFLVYFLGHEHMLDWAQFFHNQMAAFMKDHQLTAEHVTQPRP